MRLPLLRFLPLSSFFIFHFYPNWSNTMVALLLEEFFFCLSSCLAAVASRLSGRNPLVFSLIVKSASRQWFELTARRSRVRSLGWGLYRLGFPSSPWYAWVLSRFSCFLPQTRTLHARWIGNSKLFICWSECVNDYVCWFSPAINGTTCPECIDPCLHPKTAG